MFGALVRRGVVLVPLGLAAALALGCASPPPPRPPPPPEPVIDDEPDPIPEPVEITGPTPESQRPPSTASYDQALASPEPLDPNDTRVHLTDAQLSAPMRDVINKCRMPKRAKVVIKTAVQNGRAIGVTVHVTFEKPKSTGTTKPRPQSPAALRYEAKVAAKVSACFDHAVRVLTWPPNPRRDSFTTAF